MSRIINSVNSHLKDGRLPITARFFDWVVKFPRLKQRTTKKTTLRVVKNQRENLTKKKKPDRFVPSQMYVAPNETRTYIEKFRESIGKY